MSKIRLTDLYYSSNYFGSLDPALIVTTNNDEDSFNITYGVNGNLVEVRGAGEGFKFDALGEIRDASLVDSVAMYWNGQLALSITDVGVVVLANDIIAGTQGFFSAATTLDGDDEVTLTGRSDFWFESQGFDRTDFGEGLDFLVIDEARADTDLQIYGPGYGRVTDQDQGEFGFGTEDFDGLERIQFNDGILALDLTGIAGQAYRLYQAVFDRVPDIEGLGYWIRELDAGNGDLAWMASNFIISEEFQETYGTPASVDNEEFLTLIYNNVLDRNPDSAGYEYWMDELNSGFERERVLASFSESPENKANVADAIAEGIWYV